VSDGGDIVGAISGVVRASWHGDFKTGKTSIKRGLGNVFSTPAEVTIVVPSTLDIVGVRLSRIQLGSLNRIRGRGVRTRSISSDLDIE
jgi:hypothetical protein